MSKPTKAKLFSPRCFVMDFIRVSGALPGLLWLRPKIRYASKKAGIAIWQRSFHDHVIRDKNDYEKIVKYICENPIKWQYDCFYTEE